MLDEKHGRVGLAIKTLMTTKRHGDGHAEVVVLHDYGHVRMRVPASGTDDPMTDGQTREALRNAMKAIDGVSEFIKDHLHARRP